MIDSEARLRYKGSYKGLSPAEVAFFAFFPYTPTNKSKKQKRRTSTIASKFNLIQFKLVEHI